MLSIRARQPQPSEPPVGLIGCTTLTCLVYEVFGWGKGGRGRKVGDPVGGEKTYIASHRELNLRFYLPWSTIMTFRHIFGGEEKPCAEYV